MAARFARQTTATPQTNLIQYPAKLNLLAASRLRSLTDGRFKQIGNEPEAQLL